MANELSKYFGKDYLSNPQLVGLDANQKSNFTIITNKAKEKGHKVWIHPQVIVKHEKKILLST